MSHRLRAVATDFDLFRRFRFEKGLGPSGGGPGVICTCGGGADGFASGHRPFAGGIGGGNPKADPSPPRRHHRRRRVTRHDARPLHAARQWERVIRNPRVNTGGRNVMLVNS
eukprot:90615-Prorocentrum_minimum.AAC.1